jgi:hypothetical protein
MTRLIGLLVCGLVLDARSVGFWDHLAASTDLVTERGSRLLMMLIGLNGNGRPDIFIGPASLCGNGGCEWSVYSPTTKPREVRYMGEVVFSSGSFRSDPTRHSITFCIHRSAESCDLVEFSLTQAGARSRDLGECQSGEPSCEKELDRIRDWQAAHAPRILEATITTTGVLAGLKWQAQNGRGTASGAPPDLDRLIVAEPR